MVTSDVMSPDPDPGQGRGRAKSWSDPRYLLNIEHFINITHYTTRILCPAAGCWWRVWIWQFIFVIKQNSLTQHQRGRPVAKTLLFARWSDSGLPGYELACSPHFFHFIQSGAANSKHAAHTIHKTWTFRISVLQFRLILHRCQKWRTLMWSTFNLNHH